MSGRLALLKPFNTIRMRLLLALSALAFSTLFVGIFAWYWLDRTNVKLEQLHQQTLAEVARSLDLAKRSSDLSTSAPFLFNQKSSYLVKTEGRRLLQLFDQAQGIWGEANAQKLGDAKLYEVEQKISANLKTMKLAVSQLVELADNLSQTRDETRAIIAQLVQIERLASDNMTTSHAKEADMTGWRWLQSTSNLLAVAAKAESYLSLGEYRRRFVSLLDREAAAGGFITSQREFSQLEQIANGTEGLFATRRKFLADNLKAHNALFRIRTGANGLSNLVGELIHTAQTQIGERRKETQSYIAYAQISIFLAVLASVSLALISALYVSGYVTKNINMIARAMSKLASGDHSSQLPRQILPRQVLARKASQDDEIGNLLDAFRFFRANALRLKRSNRQLRQKTALFSSIFDNINVGIAIVGQNGKLIEWNPHFPQVLKLGLAPGNIQAPKKGDDIADIVRRSPFSLPHMEFDHLVGKTNYGELNDGFGQVVEMRSSPLPDGGAVWMFSDSSERKRIEERLRQFQRLESLGQLTGEVAHDFNNVLAAINGNVHLLESKKIKDRKFADALQRISSALEMGASLTQRLLAFARKQQLEPKIVDLNELVDGVSELISFSLGDDVCLETRLDDEKLLVKVDPGQMESALLNLCLNSSNAIDGKGKVSISVKALGVDGAAIEVADNGCGMSPEVLERAFEPFFSTRRSSKGSGLGLSMVFGFMKQSGGEIFIDSKPGAGTCVTLTLPRVDAMKKAVPGQLTPQVGGAEVGGAEVGGAEKILLVEDDPATLKRARKMLVSLGRQVIEASGFTAAQEIIQSGQHYDVLFTDIQLEEGCSGWALVNQLVAKNSNKKIIVTSGRFAKGAKAPVEFDGKISLIAKPYSKDELSRLLKV